MTNSKPLNVLCIGECMIELTAGDLRTIASSPRGFGGDTLNTAAYMVPALGADARVQYLTAVGTDAISDGLLNDWQELRIGTDFVQRIDDRLPGLYLIQTDAAGERRFLYWRRDSAATRLMDKIEAVYTAVAGADLVYLSGISLAILPAEHRTQLIDLLVSSAADNSTRIAFDPNFRPALWPDAATAKASFDRLAPALHFALPSTEDEALLLSKPSVSAQATADRWRALGCHEVVVTADEASALVSGEQFDAIKVSGELVANPVDTTAAGDSFNAAYLASRLRGLGPQESAHCAHTLAAQVVAAPGALVARLLRSPDA